MKRFALGNVLWGLALLVVLGMASPITAQQGLREVPKRNMFGFTGALARPVGEFGDFVDWGGGLGLYGVKALGRGSSLGLRFDGSMLIYGHESVQRPLSNMIQWVTVDIDTDNYIFSVGVGPQITVGHGPIRPYMYGTVGLSYFATISTVKGTADPNNVLSSTNFDDLNAAFTGGAGMLLRLSSGRRPVSLDFSARAVHNGEATYLKKGSVLESADGSISYVPIRSEANLVSFRIGVAVGM